MNNFANKFIAFVDILGFKRFVADAEKGTGFDLERILSLVSYLGTGKERERFEKSGPICCPCAPYVERHLDFRVTQISDCVIVSSEVSPAGIINLANHCWGAAIQLLREGVMCRGYIKRGTIYHTDSQVIGSGYQDAYIAEGGVTAFKREADERGTPYIEVDPEVTAYIDAQQDACVKEIFSRMAKREGATAALFPFRRLSHSFLGGPSHKFDAERERKSNQNMRMIINTVKERVQSLVDPANASAVAKAAHYLSALDAQLEVCDRTDEFIDALVRPIVGHRVSDF